MHDPEAARRLALRRIADADGDDDVPAGVLDEEDELAEDDEDMVFEDEDDGDYNAEVYFDGGDEDDYGDDDGGDEAIF
jgi:DNA-directed RNA polymerase III subunit RPC7